MKKRLVRLIEWYFKVVQFNPTAAFMRRKLRESAAGVEGDILDIGAGLSPYRHLFGNASSYTSTNTKSHYDDSAYEKLEGMTDVWIEDGCSLPFADGSFDAVCMFQVLSVISEPQRQFEEIRRILRPGGKFFLSTDFLYPIWSDADGMHHTAAGLRELAEKANFSVDRLESFGGFWSMLYMVTQNYFRDFPGKLGRKGVLIKMTSVLFLFPVMIISGISSLAGIFIFGFESGIKDEYRFTFNNYLEASRES